jgi:hypothetical protein
MDLPLKNDGLSKPDHLAWFFSNFDGTGLRLLEVGKVIFTRDTLDGAKVLAKNFNFGMRPLAARSTQRAN